MKPAGMHIESGWADLERAKEQEEAEAEETFLNDWIKGQLGFGS
jgi:hypothetical protein